MKNKVKKSAIKFNVNILEITWYPNPSSCVSINTKRSRPNQMPPLMVRKPQWRR